MFLAGRGEGEDAVTDRTWVFVVLLLCTIPVAGWLLKEPLLKPYRDYAVHAKEDRDKAAELRQQIKRREQAGGEVAEVLAAYGQPLSPTGRKARATAFYRRVEALVLSSGLDVQSLQPKPEQVEADGLLRFPVYASLNGDMNGVVSLLAQLRRTSGLIGLENLSLRRRDDPTKPLTVQLTLVSYAVADQATRDELARAASKGKGKP